MRSRFLCVQTAIIVVAAFSCSPDEELPVDNGAAFFPLRVGRWATYQVDSTRIIQNVASAHRYELRLTIADSAANGAGGLTFRIVREVRQDETQQWAPAGTWSAWTDARQAVITEGNTRYVKLQFPAELGMKWDGNALNSMGGEDRCGEADCDRYEVTSLADGYSNDYLTTGPALTVTQHDDPDLIVRKDIRTEIYARDIGLVRREATVLEYCNNNNACLGKQFVEDGLVYRMELKAFGNNEE